MNNFFKSFELFLTESFSEETAFIKAIFANPFDSTTKLVYADWLDERDDRFGGLVRAAVALKKKHVPIKKAMKDGHDHGCQMKRPEKNMQQGLGAMSKKLNLWEDIRPMLFTMAVKK